MSKYKKINNNISLNTDENYFHIRLLDYVETITTEKDLRDTTTEICNFLNKNQGIVLYHNYYKLLINKLSDKILQFNNTPSKKTLELFKKFL